MIPLLGCGLFTFIHLADPPIHSILHSLRFCVQSTYR
uniref:Uncharacterized protein n=1 Tax=Anguilla anguilla TaxID=7936 RepID=A0A0E9UN72_ANGAN